MGKVEDLERQIGELSGPEFAELLGWMLAEPGVAWDARVERDVAAGRLDAAVSEAMQDDVAGRSRPL